jgi:hypothetical protein
VVRLFEMTVSANISALAQTRWYEYVPRFLFGGVVTALAGVIARNYGPSVGGLFLAFPAIFPAGATLIERHEMRRKQQVRHRGTRRGRKAAALDAAGASIGTLGLLAFALLVWQLVVPLALWVVLTGATLGWLLVSISAWKAWRILRGSDA